MKIGRATTPDGKGGHGPRASDWARKWIAGGVLAVLILAVLAAGQLQTPPAAAAQTADVVVKNTAKSGTTSAALNTTHSAFAQRFTASASASADASDVVSIGIAFDEIANTSSAGSELTVTLNEESSGLPGTLLCTLNDPASFTGSGVQTFTAPAACPTLEGGNTYFVVVTRANDNTHTIILEATSQTGQDSGSASGWSIDDRAHRYIDSSSSWAPGFVLANLQIDVKGTDASATTVPANWNLIPSDPPAGGQFRLLFVTSTGHAATKGNISNYNTYVQSQANASDAHADIKAYSSTFRVLGSTESVDARDNTRTNPNTDTSVPIYWLNGDKVADNYNDLYDGSWDSETYTGKDGTAATAQRTVWTGSLNNGTESVHHDLGLHRRNPVGARHLTRVAGATALKTAGRQRGQETSNTHED